MKIRFEIPVLVGIISILITPILSCANQKDVIPRIYSETQGQFAWKRYNGNPVITWDLIPSPPGALYPVMGDPTLLYEDGKFKMWFGYGGLDNMSDTNSVRVRTAYAESDDGMRWNVISASALDVGGSNDWDRTNAETPSVIKDEILPAGHPRKYRMYYAGMDDTLPIDEIIKVGMGYGIGLAFSADGKSFTRLPASESPYGVSGLVLKPNPPQPSGSQWDYIHVADPHVLVKDGIYHIWYTSFAWDEAAQKTYLTISYATSPDGITWEKYGHIFKPDLSWETNRPEAHVGRPCVFFHNGRFEMFYDAAAIVKVGASDTSAGIGFAFSTNGTTWTKEQEPIFLPNYGKGEILGIGIGSGYFLKDGVYYIYYPGLDPDEYHVAFSLATWTPAAVSAGVCADYDGDGKADPGTYDEATGIWKVRLSSFGYSLVTTDLGGLGGPGYASIAADYDGDGKADPAVYQEATGVWKIMISSANYAIFTMSQPLGGLGYSGIPADYDGDRKADPAIYERNQGDWQVRRSSANYASIEAPVFLGGTNYLAVPADYDGDRLADPAVYGEATGDWQVRLSSGGYATTLTLERLLGGTPAPADYDGDGKADPAVKSNTGNVWIVMSSSAGYAPVPLTLSFEQ
ncbi:MAG: hypothetical protein HYV35_11130 [Lentisphaerae bacterium]|nr:hypothetical protein [Lentisphaerota bacterium]